MNPKDEYIADLIAQIARDNWTLNHDPTPAPSNDFYLERMTKFHEEVTKLQEDQDE